MPDTTWTMDSEKERFKELDFARLEMAMMIQIAYKLERFVEADEGTLKIKDWDKGVCKTHYYKNGFFVSRSFDEVAIKKITQSEITEIKTLKFLRFEK